MTFFQVSFYFVDNLLWKNMISLLRTFDSWDKMSMSLNDTKVSLLAGLFAEDMTV